MPVKRFWVGLYRRTREELQDAGFEATSGRVTGSQVTVRTNEAAHRRTCSSPVASSSVSSAVNVQTSGSSRPSRAVDPVGPFLFRLPETPTCQL